MPPNREDWYVDPTSHAVLNNDELAWLRYKAERDAAIKLQNLEQQMIILMKRIQELEERLDEATANN